MPNKAEVAAEKILSGYNWAQSVLYAFREESGLGVEKALKVACGLGAGMGRKGQVCGAVAGGILVIGSKYGRSENEGRPATEKTYAKTRELMDRFSEKHGTVICRQLLNGLDLTTEEGQRFFKENELLTKTCKPCVETVVEILEGMV